jgi:hypothetical protein
MLPMRRATATTSLLGLTLALVGCKTQSTPLNNPFLSADRVPPPQTQIPAPGTAQPYYGGPLPGAAAPLTATPTATPLTPTPAYPASTLTPTPYPAGPAYPMSAPAPTTPATPPGGWGTPAPQGTPGGTAINIPKDSQQLRLASAPAFAPNAGAQQPIKQAAYDEAPPAGQPGAQRLQIREVKPAEYMAQQATPSLGVPSASTPTLATPSRDGFRPQGSQPRAEATIESPADKGFRPPSLASGTPAGGADSNERYGVGPSQEWLRGQLEYWPTNGEWSIHYMPDGVVDQIGGRILIDNPQVLGNLPPGEFVVVQGQVFGRQIDDASYRPAFRVAAVQRQRQ